MSIDFQCPNGHSMSADEEDVGMRLRCEECFKMVRVPAPGAAPNLGPAEAPKRPPAPRAITVDHPYLRIRIGLSFHYAWILIYLLAIALAILELVARPAELEGLSGALVLLNFAIWIALFFVKPILGIAGSVYCLRVPEGANARSFLWASITLDAVSLVVGVLFFVLGAFADGDRGQDGGEFATLGNLFLGVNYLCNYLAWIFLLVFLHRFAAFVADLNTSAEAFPVGVLGTILLLAPMLVRIAIVTAVFASVRILPLGFLAAPLLTFLAFFLPLLWIVLCVKLLLRNLAMLSGLREHLLHEIEKVE